MFQLKIIFGFIYKIFNYFLFKELVQKENFKSYGSFQVLAESIFKKIFLRIN